MARAQPTSRRRARRGISVVQVEGLLDPPTAALVKNAIEDANEQRRTMLVMQIDSRGTVDVDVNEIVPMIRQSKVPIIAWVGPSGGSAQGGATLLLQASHRAFIAQGASVGPGSPVRLDDPGDPPTAAVAAELSRLAEAQRARSGGRGPSRHPQVLARASEGARRGRRCAPDPR